VVTTSVENVLAERIIHTVETHARPKDKKDEIFSQESNGVMSFKEILSAGIGPCEFDSWVKSWPTPGGQQAVRAAVARKLEDLEIC
jgi:hypothetical protein